jgi:uncharacterized protein (TIGR02246 family)
MPKRFFLFPILILLIAVADSIGAAPSGDAKLDSAIQKANNEFLAAIKTGDAATIAAPYAETGVFILPDGKCIQGRAEIEKMYRTNFEKGGPPSSSTLDSKSVVLDGDVAYESGSGEITEMKDGKAVTRTSRYLTVWRRAADGEWKIIRNIVL